MSEPEPLAPGPAAPGPAAPGPAAHPAKAVESEPFDVSAGRTGFDEWLHRSWGTSRGTGGFKFESMVYLGTAAFFAVVLALYWFTSYEDGGSVMLLFTVCLGLLPGGYMFFWSRRMKRRPEDRLDAEVDDGVGPVGSFPDQSVWPFVLGTGMGFCALALVFGPWLALIGGLMAIFAAAGVTVESRRGGSV
ncbi:MAG: aa3-type cytochrome oxidase subunit IV [Acidimicrobiales bacterium]